MPGAAMLMVYSTPLYIIEIPGTPDAQSSAGKGGGKNTLGIVETEIYEPVRKK